MAAFTPKLPLSFGDKPSYQNIETTKALVQQNLKNLCLTVPGERLMDKNFGVGMKTFLFEPNLEITYGDISAKIDEQVGIYMPFVEIDDIVIFPDELNENLAHVQVKYFITPTSESDILNLSVSR